MKKILLVRTDRLGDAILSAPVALAAKKHFAAASITFLVREYTAPIVQSFAAVDRTIVLDHFLAAHGGVRIQAMARHLRAQKFELAIHLHPLAALALTTFLAGIPYRLGTGYRFFSPLFNLRHYEHRRHAQFHEAEYNLRMLRPLGIHMPVPVFSLRIAPEAHVSIDRLLSEAEIVRHRPLVVLHPGSGGSSRDWPPAHFAGLAKLLLEKNTAQVVLTGNAAEKPLVDKIKAICEMKPASFAGRLNLQELAALLQRADVVVGNSSGPLHLAVALGSQVVAFYPPIRACRPERWGPYGRRQDVLMSRDEECFECRRAAPGTVCACMQKIPVSRAFSRVLQKLPGKKKAFTTNQDRK